MKARRQFRGMKGKAGSCASADNMVCFTPSSHISVLTRSETLAEFMGEQ